MIQSMTEPERYPNVRSGERAPISGTKRRLIIERDNWRCQLGQHVMFCGPDVDYEIDHVMPWSAGGSDHATNLRAACPACNQRRSNFRWDGDDRRRLPVVPVCQRCASLFADRGESTILAYCGKCGEDDYVQTWYVDAFEGFEAEQIPELVPEMWPILYQNRAHLDWYARQERGF